MTDRWTCDLCGENFNDRLDADLHARTRHPQIPKIKALSALRRTETGSVTLPDQMSAWCLVCQRQTLHARRPFNHILHLLLACVTFGFWIIIWIGEAGSHKRKPLFCSVCGTQLDSSRVKVASEVKTLPAGWYSDPYREVGQRWWDGHGWSDYTEKSAQSLPPPKRARSATQKPPSANAPGG